MGRNAYSCGPYLDNSWTSVNTGSFGGVNLSFTFQFPKCSSCMCVGGGEDQDFSQSIISLLKSHLLSKMTIT